MEEGVEVKSKEFFCGDDILVVVGCVKSEVWVDVELWLYDVVNVISIDDSIVCFFGFVFECDVVCFGVEVGCFVLCFKDGRVFFVRVW